MGDPRNPLTFIVKYYQEFDAEHTFEGHTFDVAFTAKFLRCHLCLIISAASIRQPACGG
jgi:hypothetical protein